MTAREYVEDEPEPWFSGDEESPELAIPCCCPSDGTGPDCPVPGHLEHPYVGPGGEDR